MLITSVRPLFFQSDIEDFEDHLESASKNLPLTARVKNFRHLVTTSPLKKSTYIDGQTIKYKASIENKLEKQIEKDKFFKCFKCSETFHTGGEWQTHCSTVHPSGRHPQRKYEFWKSCHKSCNICGRRFATVISLQKHKNTVHDLSGHLCSECLFIGDSVSELNKHTKAVHPGITVKGEDAEENKRDGEIAEDHEDLPQLMQLDNVMEEELDGCMINSEHMVGNDRDAKKSRVVDLSELLGSSPQRATHTNKPFPLVTDKMENKPENEQITNNDQPPPIGLNNATNIALDRSPIQSRYVVDIDVAAETGRIVDISGLLDSYPKRATHIKEPSPSAADKMENKPENEQITDHDQSPPILLDNAMDEALDRSPIQSRYVVDIDDAAETASVVDLSRLSEFPQKKVGHKKELNPSVESKVEKHKSPTTFRRGEEFRHHVSSINPVPVKKAYATNKDNVCKICDKVFKTNYILKKHQMAFHDQKHCEKCNYKTSSNRLLQEHGLNKHGASNNHNRASLRPVQKADKATRNAADQEEAEKFTNFHCFQCPLKCNTIRDLREHISIEHKKQSTVTKSPKKKPAYTKEHNISVDDKIEQELEKKHKKFFMCNKCGAKFHKGEELRKHYATAHPSEKRSPRKYEVKTRHFICQLCDKGFKTNYTLQKHIISIHDEKLCGKCEYKTSSNHHLILHKLNKHGSPDISNEERLKLAQEAKIGLAQEAGMRSRETTFELEMHTKVVHDKNEIDGSTLEESAEIEQDGKVVDNEDDHSQPAQLDDVMDEVLDGCTIQSEHVVDIEKAADKSRVVDMSNSFGDDSPVFFSGAGEPFLDEPFTAGKKAPKSKVNSNSFPSES